MKNKIISLLEVLKKNEKICIGAGAFIFLIILIIILTNKNTFAETPENTLTITCPETASAGETIECTINAGINTITTLGIGATYVVTEGLAYDSFVTGSNWVQYASSENGFAIGNTNGLTGSIFVGTLKYIIPDTAKANDIFNITLTEIELSNKDDLDNGIELEDTSAEIRILSDINTLNSISGITLNEEFNSDINDYTATTDAENIEISVEKTDDRSIVTGAIGALELHYGTNILSIVVTSETGVDNTYTLTVYRPYEFTSNNYTYNKENNYLYTKADTEKNTIISNIEIPSDLTASINNNKLDIKYNDEILLEINLINISSSKYTIIDNTIYIGKDTTYEVFNSNITLNGVTVKVFKENNEVTTGVLEEDDTIKVYYNDTELETYTLNEEYLNFDNSLILDDTNKVFKRMELNTTYNDLIEKIDTTGNIEIKDKNNKTLAKTDKVKTGDVITIKMSKDTYSYTISVLGDINGDGIANNGDVALLYRQLKGKENLENYKIAAGDILNDGNIKINDVSRLYRYFKGKVSTLEVIR